MHFAVYKDIESIRKTNPLIHNITNLVVMNESANALLAIGASPIMAHHISEIEEVTSISDALILNTGTIEPELCEAMIVAGKTANKQGKPVVLDPVGCGISKLRAESCKKILDEVKISIIRSNAAEAASLVGMKAISKGVDSISVNDDITDIAKAIATNYDTVSAITGEIDTVSDGKNVIKISNGHIIMTKVVGMGCTLSAITAAFAVVNSDMLRAGANALAAFAVAGEVAAKKSCGLPGSFETEMINVLYTLDEDIIRKKLNMEHF